jgi:hypothetical protein
VESLRFLQDFQAPMGTVERASVFVVCGFSGHRVPRVVFWLRVEAAASFFSNRYFFLTVRVLK